LFATSGRAAVRSAALEGCPRGRCQPWRAALREAARHLV